MLFKHYSENTTTMKSNFIATSPTLHTKLLDCYLAFFIVKMVMAMAMSLTMMVMTMMKVVIMESSISGVERSV